MKKPIVKKVLTYTAVTFILLAVVTAVHVYLVTGPGKVDYNTVALARVDIKQSDATVNIEQMGTWLSKQRGVEHYLFNPKTNILVFSYRPAVVSATDIASDISQSFNCRASRYMPTAEEMKGGCPVSATSITYKTYNFFKHIL